MKKLLLFVAVATLSITAAQSQSFRIGAKAGANFASLNGDGADGLDGRTSFHIGGVARIGFTEMLSLQPELVFSSQGYSVDLGDEDASVRLGYINLPIMADVTLVEGFSLQGGPQVGFNVTSDVKFDGDTEDIDDVETIDFGVGIGAQYILPMNLFFQARYVIGVTDIAEDAEAKNSVISLSVGYFFN